MILEHQKKLFDLFTEKLPSVIFYEKLKDLIGEIEFQARGEENYIFYRDCTELLGSLNNTGCEQRRDEQIHKLQVICDRISKQYECFLP